MFSPVIPSALDDVHTYCFLSATIHPIHSHFSHTDPIVVGYRPMLPASVAVYILRYLATIKPPSFTPIFGQFKPQWAPTGCTASVVGPSLRPVVAHEFF